MYCQNCGGSLEESSKFCGHCGVIVNNSKLGATPSSNKNEISRMGRIGYSDRINDPAFAKYLKDTNRWSAIFSVIIALMAIIGFFIYGEVSTEMDNPQAIYIGCGIGGMFITIAILQIIGRGRTTTWDGTVVDKKVLKKRRKQYNTGNDYYWQEYTEFIIVIKSDRGKEFNIRDEDDDTQFNYYKIGDRVRRHKGLNSYEKYDKSKDSIVFCNACASLNDIKDEFCFRCKCPLLK